LILKDRLIFSIDNESTKAIDDAISIEKIFSKDEFKWELGIHISNVGFLIDE
jgi:exoribonuclease R